MSGSPNCFKNILIESILSFSLSGFGFFMAFPLEEYSKIKDNYCITYSGHCNEFIVQLKYLYPFIEKQLPGIKITIACQRHLLDFFEKDERLLDVANLEIMKTSFCYIDEIKCNMTNHPIEEIFIESNLTIPQFSFQEKNTNKCVILTKNTPPTRPIKEEHIQALEKKYQHMNVVINGNELDAELIIGVENAHFYRASFSGTKTILLDTGIGTNFYKKLFPDGKVLSLENIYR